MLNTIKVFKPPLSGWDGGSIPYYGEWKKYWLNGKQGNKNPKYQTMKYLHFNWTTYKANKFIERKNKNIEKIYMN